MAIRISFRYATTYLSCICITPLEVQIMSFSDSNLATLSMEQQFQLTVYKEQIQTLTQEKAQEYLLEMFRQMMIKDNLVKDMLKNK